MVSSLDLARRRRPARRDFISTVGFSTGKFKDTWTVPAVDTPQVGGVWLKRQVINTDGWSRGPDWRVISVQRGFWGTAGAQREATRRRDGGMMQIL